MSLLGRFLETSAFLAFVISCISIIILIIHITNGFKKDHITSSYYDGTGYECNIEEIFASTSAQGSSQYFDKPVKVCIVSDNTIMLIKEWNLNKTSKELISNNEMSTITYDRFTPVSIHKHLRPNVKTDSDPTDRLDIQQHFTLTFDTDTVTQLNEHVRGAKVLHDGLLILYAGLYYIYSNVSYKRSSVLHRNDSNIKTWHTYLHRVSPNSPWNSGVLLRSVYTPCNTCTELEESSYIGGVFYLLQGDIIQICLSNPDVDNFNSESSFVGLFKLAS